MGDKRNKDLYRENKDEEILQFSENKNQLFSIIKNYKLQRLLKDKLKKKISKI